MAVAPRLVDEEYVVAAALLYEACFAAPTALDCAERHAHDDTYTVSYM